MKFCTECGAGKQSNSDKSDCGKKNKLYFCSTLLNNEYKASSKPLKYLVVFELTYLKTELCEEGTYKDSTMKFCTECGAGKQSNSDKSDCGKKNKLYLCSTL